MKMEDLNNSQLILMAILVSFVTSIATGILTVSLLDEQSPTVTQTINRVVERTVEKVVPGDTRTVVREVPVIVTEEELIVKVINDASPTVGRLTESRTAELSLGLAFVVDEGKYLVTAASVLPGETNKRTGPYYLSTEDGIEYRAELAALSSDKRLAVLKVTEVSLPEVPAPTLLSALLPQDKSEISAARLSTGNLSVGQTVIALGSIGSSVGPVTVGIISSLSPAIGTTTAITTNAARSDNLGGPLFSIQGEVVGLNLAPGTAAPAALVRALIDSIK